MLTKIGAVSLNQPVSLPDSLPSVKFPDLGKYFLFFLIFPDFFFEEKEENHNEKLFY